MLQKDFICENILSYNNYKSIFDICFSLQKIIQRETNVKYKKSTDVFVNI